MTYNVNYTDITKTPIEVNDTTINTQTSIGLVGKKYSRYGEAIAENFLHLLENFANSTTPVNPTEGQLWYDNNNNIMKYYTANSDWKSFANVFTGGSQPATIDSNIGDIWINTTNNTVLFYINNAWVTIGNTSGGSTPVVGGTVTNGIATKTRYDTSNNTHSTVEVIVNSKTVAIYSSDDADWVPSITDPHKEYVEGSPTILLFTQFPVIKKGMNLNPFGTTRYGLHNYDVVKLGSNTTPKLPITIDIGRGIVSLENNSYDNINGGSGLTVKPSIETADGSIFSVRNLSNVSKLWTSQSLTSSGTNSFCVGFTGALGQESDPTKYNIKLESNGTVSASLIAGSWIATQAEANAGSVTNKIMTPSVTKTLLDSYNFIPSGAIMAFAMNTVPTGWLACSGTAISRTTYATLYAAIGTIYGSGDGSTTFNLPDFRGVFLRGIDNSRGLDTGRVMGSYQLDEFKAHTHTITDPGHSHTVNVASQDTAGNNNIDGSDNSGSAKATTTTTTGITINTTGSAAETRPKNNAILYCIKV